VLNSLNLLRTDLAEEELSRRRDLGRGIPGAMVPRMDG
jgi:hypothetical protein